MAIELPTMVIKDGTDVTNRRLPKRYRSLLLTLMIVIGTNLFIGTLLPPRLRASEPATITVPDSALTVYFFDVDQGDSTLFLGDGFSILVDAGRHDRDDVVPYLKAVGVETIDLFIGTHPHADHIGQCESVLKSFYVKEVWLSGDVHPTRTFERCIDAILESDADYVEPRAGDTFDFGTATIEVIHPEQLTGHLNNGSIGIRLAFGNVVFLLTGDAEREAEEAMLRRGHNLQAHVLHVGHHGSKTSSTTSFLAAVNPDVAIYSAGRDNPYGHPHPETIRQFSILDTVLYGTDVHGTIKIVSDGLHYEVSTAHAITKEIDVPPLDGSVCSVGQIDLNSALKDELTNIVGIGPVLSERIVEARPFWSLDDLTRVRGIGDKTLAIIREEGVACVASLRK